MSQQISKIISGETDNNEGGGKIVAVNKKSIKPGKKKPTFVCVMCQEKFESHTGLKDHFREHAFKNKSSSLKNPVSNTEVKCEFCSTVFPSISKALQHKFKDHSTIGNSFCEFCGKLFPFKFLLNQHKEKAHSEELLKQRKSDEKSDKTSKEKLKEIDQKSLSCSLCPAKFLTSEALNVHFHGAHEVSLELLMPVYLPPPSTKIKLNNASEVYSVYYCHICGSEYIMKHNLRKHIRDEHATEELNELSEGIIRCKTCEALFFNQKAYLAHLTYHRPGDLHVSSEEQRERILSRVDQDFDARRVPNISEELARNAMVKEMRKRTRIRNKASTSKQLIKARESSDEEEISPPSTPSDSEDEQASNINIKKKSKILYKPEVSVSQNTKIEKLVIKPTCEASTGKTDISSDNGNSTIPSKKCRLDFDRLHSLVQ